MTHVFQARADTVYVSKLWHEMLNSLPGDEASGRVYVRDQSAINAGFEVFALLKAHNKCIPTSNAEFRDQFGSTPSELRAYLDRAFDPIRAKTKTLVITYLSCATIMPLTQMAHEDAERSVAADEYKPKQD